MAKNPSDYDDPRLDKFVGAGESLEEAKRSLLETLAQGGSKAVEAFQAQAPAPRGSASLTHQFDERYAQPMEDHTAAMSDANSVWFDRMKGVTGVMRQDADNQRLRLQTEADFALRQNEQAYEQDRLDRGRATSAASSRSYGGGGGGSTAGTEDLPPLTPEEIAALTPELAALLGYDQTVQTENDQVAESASGDAENSAAFAQASDAAAAGDRQAALQIIASIDDEWLERMVGSSRTELRIALMEEAALAAPVSRPRGSESGPGYRPYGG